MAGNAAEAGLDGFAVAAILTGLRMHRRVVYNLLTMTALLAAMGTDYLAQAGTLVQADAVISVAEKMAVRFSKSFPQRSSQPVTRLEGIRQTALVTQEYPTVSRDEPQQARNCSAFTLHLPPPLGQNTSAVPV